MARQETKPGLEEPKEASGSDLAGSVGKYNHTYEGSDSAEGPLIAYILNHPKLVSAVEKAGSGRGLVVEVGPYGGRTLAEFAGRYADNLSLIIGIDRGDYSKRPESLNGFKSVHLAELMNADQKSLLNIETLSQAPVTHSIYRHDTHPNTFAIYQAKIEDVLYPDTTADLVLLKFMMGYLLKDMSLNDIKKTVFARSKRIFMIDYIGQCEYTEVAIPDPQTLALSLQDMDVGYEKGENYFVLWAQETSPS